MDGIEYDEIEAGRYMGFYEILLYGEIEKFREIFFAGLTLEPRGDGTTKLSGSLRDQSALYGVINTIRDMGLEILKLEKM